LGEYGKPLKFKTHALLQHSSNQLAMSLTLATQQVIAPITATGSTTPRLLQNRFADVVNVKDFGAKGDGTTDDTAACQAAINYALANNLGLQVSGLCYITASLIINRQVDTTTNVFCISASGTGQGFLVKAGVTLFNTTLNPSTIGNPVVSEFVRFFGVQFQAQTPSDFNTFVISGLFLRINFESCHFQAIKCMNTTLYAQSWYFLNNTIRRWENGAFFRCVGCFDISFINNLSEFGNTFFYSKDGGISGARFIGNLFENFSGYALGLDGCQGVEISGNYFEANGTALSYPDPAHIHLWIGSIAHTGLNINANYFALGGSKYAIYWGPINYATTSNNSGYRNALHGNSIGQQNISSFQEFAYDDGTYTSTTAGGVSTVVVSGLTIPSGTFPVGGTIQILNATNSILLGTQTITANNGTTITFQVTGTASATGSLDLTSPWTLWNIPRGNSQYNLVQNPYSLITANGVFKLDVSQYSIFELSTTNSTTNTISLINATGLMGQTIKIMFLNSSGSTITNAPTFPSNFKLNTWSSLIADNYVIIEFFYQANIVAGGRWYECSRSASIPSV